MSSNRRSCQRQTMTRRSVLSRGCRFPPRAAGYSIARRKGCGCAGCAGCALDCRGSVCSCSGRRRSTQKHKHTKGTNSSRLKIGSRRISSKRLPVCPAVALAHRPMHADYPAGVGRVSLLLLRSCPVRAPPRTRPPRAAERQMRSQQEPTRNQQETNQQRVSETTFSLRTVSCTESQFASG